MQIMGLRLSVRQINKVICICKTKGIQNPGMLFASNSYAGSCRYADEIHMLTCNVLGNMF